MNGQRHGPTALSAEKRRGTHLIGGWLGPRLVWTGAENLAHTGIRSPDPSARSYTDYAIPAHIQAPLICKLTVSEPSWIQHPITSTLQNIQDLIFTGGEQCSFKSTACKQYCQLCKEVWFQWY